MTYNEIKSRIGNYLLIAVILISLTSSLTFLSFEESYAQPTTIHITSNADFDTYDSGGDGSSSDPWVIEGHTIDASGDHGIWIEDTSDHFIIRNCTVENGGSSYHGIYLDNAPNGRIDDVVSKNNDSGIRVINSYPVVLDNNFLEGNDDAVRFGDDADVVNTTIILENNHLQGNDYGFNFYDDLDNIVNSQVYIRNNTIVDNPSYAIDLDTEIYSSEVEILNNIIENNDYEGVYFDYIIDSTVTIANNVIDNNGDEGLYFPDDVYGDTVISIENNSIVGNDYQGIYLDEIYDNTLINIQNNFIDNNGDAGIYVDDYVYENARINIINNSIDGNEDEGIYFYDDIYGNAVINIENNSIDKNDDGGILFDDYVYGNARIFIVNNSVDESNYPGIEFDDDIYENVRVGIIGNSIDNNDGDGIRLDDIEDNTYVEITNNSVDGNNSDGLSFRNDISGLSKVIVSKNSFSNNSDSGVYYSDDGILDNALLRIDNNIFRNNIGLFTGIHFDETLIGENAVVDITRNLIDNNGTGILAYPIFIQGSMNILFNDIVNNVGIAEPVPETGIHIYSPVFCTMVRYNNIENNIIGAYYSGPGDLNALQNWWGASNGPGGEGPGDGDNVSPDVLYTPWLTEPVDRNDLTDWSGTRFSDGQGQSFTSDDGKIEVNFDSKENGRILIEQMKKVAGTTDVEDKSSVMFFDISAKPENSVENIWITVNYTDDDVDGIDESNMKAYYWSSTDEEWKMLENIEVDAANNTLTGYAPHLTPFGLFGTPNPAEFKVSDLVIDPEKADISEAVTISAKVKNTGGMNGTYTAKLKINNALEDKTDVNLDPGESKRVSFEVTRGVPGIYSVELGGLTGSFEVLGEASFRVVSLTAIPETAMPTDTVTVTAVIVNAGEIAGTYEAILREGTRIVGNKMISLNGGEQDSVVFSMSNFIPGRSYTVNMDGVSETFDIKAVGGLRAREYDEDEGTNPLVYVATVLGIAVIAFMAALIVSEAGKR